VNTTTTVALGIGGLLMYSAVKGQDPRDVVKEALGFAPKGSAKRGGYGGSEGYTGEAPDRGGPVTEPRGPLYREGYEPPPAGGAEYYPDPYTPPVVVSV
jgi:hypothetical protein